jgi:hypothetical protein
MKKYFDPILAANETALHRFLYYPIGPYNYIKSKPSINHLFYVNLCIINKLFILSTYVSSISLIKH